MSSMFDDFKEQVRGPFRRAHACRGGPSSHLARTRG